jgi:hypothetical protein
MKKSARMRDEWQASITCGQSVPYLRFVVRGVELSQEIALDHFMNLNAAHSDSSRETRGTSQGGQRGNPLQSDIRDLL